MCAGMMRNIRWGSGGIWSTELMANGEFRITGNKWKILLIFKKYV